MIEKIESKMWVHFPSFLVGSAFSGAAFLLVHQQLSYRSRLTKKWPLREKFEAKIKEIRSRGKEDDTKALSATDSLTKSWNEQVNKAKNAFRKDD